MRGPPAKCSSPEIHSARNMHKVHPRHVPRKHFRFIHPSGWKNLLCSPFARSRVDLASRRYEAPRQRSGAGSRPQNTGGLREDPPCRIPCVRGMFCTLPSSHIYATNRRPIAPSVHTCTVKRSAVVAIGVDRGGIGLDTSAPWHLTGGHDLGPREPGRGEKMVMASSAGR